MDNINLETIKSGLPTLTEEWGSFLAQSAQFCLEEHHHRSGVILRLVQSDSKEAQIIWNEELDKRARDSFGDQDEAVEYGATCIAILLSIKYTEFPTVSRSWKGTGFDYWLGHLMGDDTLPFQGQARLEISGIFNGDDKKVSTRIERKRRQTSRSDSSGLPAYISVVEFANPIGSLTRK